MIFNRKKLQLIYKFFISQLFKIIYGNVIFSNKNDNDVKFTEINISNQNYIFVEINNGRIFTDYVENVAIINKNQILNHVSYQQIKGEFKDPSLNVVIKKGTPKFKKKIKGKVFSLVQGASGNNNYFHWMFDVLPRLIMLEKVYNLNEVDYFYTPQIKSWQLSTLSVFNISEEKLINSNHYRHIQSDKILAVEHPWYNKGRILDQAKKIPNWIINEIASRFEEYGKKFECSNKIFIDRRESHYNHCQIVNDEEIKIYLKKKGFAILKIGKLNFFEQIHLFQNAKIIIGAHGAAFANLIFCKPNTKVLDIIPENHPNTVDEKIAKLKNLDFKYIKTKELSVEKRANGDIFLPIEKIDTIL
tara:strand:+ start:2764 stop:3840 length:1077 start_codon:yes stop_codon:yes gene_type:complete